MYRGAIVLIIAAFILIGCGTETVEFYQGRVVDSFGNGVENVKIGLEYNWINRSRIADNIEDKKKDMKNVLSVSSRPITSINFNLDEAAYVVLWIEKKCTQDSVDLLIDQHMSAGSYSVLWNGMNGDGLRVTSGEYVAHVEYGFHALEIDFLLITGFENVNYFETEYDAITDEYGRFALETNCMLLNNEYPGIDENGHEIGMLKITGYVNIAAIPEFSESITIDSVYLNPMNPDAFALEIVLP